MERVNKLKQQAEQAEQAEQAKKAEQRRRIDLLTKPYEPYEIKGTWVKEKPGGMNEPYIPGYYIWTFPSR